MTQIWALSLGIEKYVQSIPYHLALINKIFFKVSLTNWTSLLLLWPVQLGMVSE